MPLPMRPHLKNYPCKPPFAAPSKGDQTHAVSHALHTTLLPLTVLMLFLAPQAFILLATARTESSSIHFNSLSL